jgi:hypothetical protein
MKWYLRTAAALGLGVAGAVAAQPPSELPAVPTPPATKGEADSPLSALPAIPTAPAAINRETQPPKSDAPVPTPVAPPPHSKTDQPAVPVIPPLQGPTDVIPEHMGGFSAGWGEFRERFEYPGAGGPATDGYPYKAGHCRTGRCREDKEESLADVVMPPLWTLVPQDGRVRVRGWLDAGDVYNASNPTSKYNGPYSAVDRNRELTFNQGYLIAERVRPADGSFGFGMRTDLLFGEDFFLPQSRGFETNRDGSLKWNGTYYGLAIPQAYLELGTDIWSLKLGHFYSPVGYESVMSLDNFFYTHAYSYMFGQAYTLWGGLLAVQWSKNWQVIGGLTNAWDTLDGNFNDLNAIYGVKYTPDCQKFWASYMLISGKNDSNPAGLPGVPTVAGNRTLNSLLIGVTPGGPDGRWEYVVHGFYGWQEDGTNHGDFALWYGVDQYLYYRLTQTLRLGTRFEWFRDDDGTRVGLNRPNNPNKPPLPGNYFSLSGGVNWIPHPNVIVRPEIRWDFTNNTAGNKAFNDGRTSQQLLVAGDVIIRY